MERATGVCFKLLDAVPGSQEWNALERGFLCSTPTGLEFWRLNSHLLSRLGQSSPDYASSSGLSHLFPRADRSCVLHWVLGTMLLHGKPMEHRPFSLFSVSSCLRPVPGCPETHCSSATSIYARPIFFLSVPAGVESGATSGTRTTGPD